MEPFNSSVVWVNAATLFCCEAPEMFAGQQNVSDFPSAWCWGFNDWIWIFGWTVPLRRDHMSDEYPPFTPVCVDVCPCVNACVRASVNITSSLSCRGAPGPHVRSKVCGNWSPICWLEQRAAHPCPSPPPPATAAPAHLATKGATGP